MLDPREKAVFDGMVTQLRSEDPTFSRRVDRLTKPRHTLRLTAAILLWTLAPVSIVYGGWTGLILAVLAVTYGALLFRRRNTDTAPQPWWPATRGRRPGAAI